MMRLITAAAVTLSLAAVSTGLAEPQLTPTEPDVIGDWRGEWGPFNPAKSSDVDEESCKQLDCRVVRTTAGWQATFEGECGRPYKYTITMEGRQAGPTVLFKGTADLGPNDGGVHDWVGRAKAGEFIGFYSSEHHTGFFRLSRKPPNTSTADTPQ